MTAPATILRRILRGALLALALSGFAATNARAQAPVGALSFNVEDLPGEPPIPVQVWYPASASGVNENGEPAGDPVQPLPGRRSLIMLSHGSGGTPLNQRDLILYLAAAGSIVAGPLHPYDNATDHSGPGTDLQLIGRPRHIARSIDALLAHPLLGPLIDPARIGIIGYSAGGYTALVVIGGEPNFALGPEHCARTQRDRMFCGWMRRGGIQRLRPDWTITHDPRVRAAVLLAPAYGVFFDKRGLANVKAAVRMYRAEADEVVRHPYNEDQLRRALPRPPEYAVVPGGHFVFVSPCRRPSPAMLCRDPAGVDRVAIHHRMNAEIRDFFDRTLKGSR
jgi:predicted dienelactone hydrolase